MANLARSVKPSSEWTKDDVLAFNIGLVDRTVDQFFGMSADELAERPLVHVSPITLTADDLSYYPSESEEEIRLHVLMEDADPQLTLGVQRYVGDFAAVLLRTLEYNKLDGKSGASGRRVIHSRMEPGFQMCGQKVFAETDIVVMHRVGPQRHYILLVQEDKVRASQRTPEVRNRSCTSSQFADTGVLQWPQLVAAAIAAYSENQLLRDAHALPRQESCVMYAITLSGTSPTFYKIPVTSTLRLAVSTGTYPSELTVVERCIPPIPVPSLRVHGLLPVVNRRFLFQCFDAFKAFLASDLVVCSRNTNLLNIVFSQPQEL
jgi:hypothetical protein